MENSKFYASLSENYDSMINFEKSVENKSNLLGKIFSVKNLLIADIGSGTGVDSIALTKLGATVHGFEPAIEMIQKAEENSIRFSQTIQFYNYALSEIPSKFDKQYDIVVCLGNVLANIPENQLEISLSKLVKLLKTDGRFVIQILNYEKILKEKERIVNITRKGRKTYVRFYDFLTDYLQFNILIYETEKPQNRELISTPIYPHKKEKIQRLLQSNKHLNIEYFGSLSLEPFDKNRSNDLVIIGSRC